MKQLIRIGIIAPYAIGQEIKSVLQEFPSFQPVFRFSDRLEDAAVYAEELIDLADILFFSGRNSYEEAGKLVPFTIPAHYIPLKGSGLYRSLYSLRKKSGSLHSISADLALAGHVRAVLEELGEKETAVYTASDAEAHKENVENYYCSGVLTGRKTVAEELEFNGVYAEWVRPASSDISSALERALLATEKRKSLESQVVIGFIKVYKQDRKKGSLTEHKEQRMKLKLHERILDYVEVLEGYVTGHDGDEYSFVTTRGSFERVSEGYKSIPLLMEAGGEAEIPLLIGVGFGVSAGEAGAHARIAFNQSEEYGENSCFIVKEDKTAFGPVQIGKPIVYRLTHTDEEQIRLARAAGMTAFRLDKLLAKLVHSSKENFSAQEMASILGVTTRTAHRILLQWTEAGVAEAAGQEKATVKGRPRQLYKIASQEK